MKKTVGFVNPAFGVVVYDQNGNVLYDQNLGNEIPINPIYPEWHEIGTVIFNPEGNTALTIEFVSQGPAASGNDYTIDDIGLYDISFPIYSPVKSVNMDAVNLNSTVTYTVTLNYPGNSVLADVFFKDILPEGMAFAKGSVSVNGVNYPDADPNDGFIVPDINSDETLTVIFDAIASQIPAVNPTINTAQISYSYSPVQGGITSRYDTVSNDIEVEILAADLAVIKTADNTSVLPGDFITFTLTVTNNGPSTAVNPVLVDNIPSQIRDVVYSTDDGVTWNTWSGSWFLPDLKPSETTTILLQGQVQLFARDSFVNTTSVFSDITDPDTTDNTSDITITITESADLSVVKSASPSPVGTGDILTYTLLVSNAGPSDADNVIVEDVVSDDIENPVYSLDGSVWQPWENPLSLGMIPRSSVTTILIRGIVSGTATGSIVNTAAVASDTPDPNLDNNISTVITPIEVPPDIEADLAITKTAYSTIISGHEIEYTIKIDNLGPNSAEDTVLVDAIPAEILNPEYSVGSPAIWSPWTGSLSLGTVAYPETITILIRGIVGPAATETISNTATVISSTPDPDPSNNSSQLDTHVDVSADMQITKNSMQNPVIAGTMLTYRITARNNGPSYAHNIVIADDIPSEIITPEYSTDGLTWQPWQGSYVLDTLANNASFNIRIRGIVAPDILGIITNEATVRSDTPDPDPGNNASTANTQITGLADLSVVKSAHPAPAKAGEEIIFTLTVANLGPSTATGVTVSDSITTRITGVQYSLDGGSNWFDWASSAFLGMLQPNISFDVLIRGTLIDTAQGNITNVATVSSLTPDPNPSNNTSIITLRIIPQFAGLRVTKTASVPFVQVGDVLTYTLAVQNLGPNAALNAKITDLMPTALTTLEYSVNNGFEWMPWLGSYTIPVIEAQEKSMILVRGTVIDANFPIANTATVLSDTADPDLSDNSSTVITFASRRCDLVIAKTSDSNPAVAGEIITFVLTVTNNGPAVAENVVVYDTMPQRVQGVEFSTDNGQSWQSWQGSVSLGSLEAGLSINVLLRGNLVSTAVESVVNTAIADSTTPGHNARGWASLILPVKPIPQKSADLSLIKSTNQVIVKPGDIVTYKIQITNNGPDNANDVTLIDTLPSEFISGEFSADNGETWKPWGGSYSIGSMDVGKEATILLWGVLGILISNVVNAAIVTSTTPDPDMSNNYDTAISQTKCPPCPPPISKEEALNLIIYSIAMEELALSHIINAEGEKIQYALGTLNNIGGSGATIEEVLEVNASVAKVLEIIVHLNMTLKQKLAVALRT